MYYIYINYKNIEVIKDYLDIIKKALELNGEKVKFTKEFSEVNKTDTLIIPLATDAIKMYLKGYRNIIIWQQGVSPEESFLRNHSYLRKLVLSNVDRFVMKHAKHIFFVSEAMKLYYQKVHKTDYSDKSFIMPCFNEMFNPIAFETDRKYDKKVFTYVGSLDVWQCFDETIELYKEIESKLCDTKLRVYTFDVESARRRIIEKEIKNYSVERVPKNEVANRMNEVSYGFVIRKDNIINRVATPTKLSTYLASGVIPIFSDCLQDFYNLSKAMKYVYAVPSIVDVDSIIEFCRKPIIVNEIKEEYKAVFNSYYSKEKYIKEISSFFIDDIRNRCL